MGLQGTVQRRAASRHALIRPHPEERAGWSGPAKSNARARISKDEDGHGGALMLRDASQRASAVKASALALRCAAPQHEGGRVPCIWRDEPNAHFGERTPAEAARLIRAKDQPVDVEDGRRRGGPVSGLFFTGSCATQTRIRESTHKHPAGAAQTHPIAAEAGRAAAGAGKSSVIKARLMVAWRVADVIFAPKRSVT